MFDKMFKKNAFDQKLDDTFEKLVENNPVMRKARATIDEGENNITRSLERELYGDGAEISKNHPILDGDNEDIMQNWSSMMDQIFEKKLDAYKICPSCAEAVSAELDHCPHCGTRLPEYTAAASAKCLSE